MSKNRKLKVENRHFPMTTLTPMNNRFNFCRAIMEHPSETIYFTVAEKLLQGVDWKLIRDFYYPINRYEDILYMMRMSIYKDHSDDMYLEGASPDPKTLEDESIIYIPTSAYHWIMMKRGIYPKPVQMTMVDDEVSERFGVYFYDERNDDAIAEARYRAMMDKRPIIVKAKVKNKYLFRQTVIKMNAIPTVYLHHLDVIDIEELNFKDTLSVKALGKTCEGFFTSPSLGLEDRLKLLLNFDHDKV